MEVEISKRCANCGIDLTAEMSDSGNRFCSPECEQEFKIFILEIIREAQEKGAL